jgi:sodium-dependent phosphate cotransporter
MPVTAQTSEKPKDSSSPVLIRKIYKTSFWKIFWLAGPVLLFLFSLDLLSMACNMLSKELIDSILTATSNPFIGLFIGLLTTAIIQSSSTTTSMTVAVVASGTISLEHAIPIIIGANIGTTITATVVAFNHIFRRKEFQRALSAATLNGFFNILTATIILPFEYYTQFLSKLCILISSLFVTGANATVDSRTHGWIEYSAKYVTQLLPNYPLVTAIAAVFLLFLSIYWLVLTLKSLFVYNVGKKMEQIVFGTRYKSLFWGVFSTALLQSSSVTTSFAVPLVASKKASLRQVFPFIMGANVGTTFTALFASLSNVDASLSIAFAHLLFNTIGVCIFFFIPVIKELPLVLAQMLGKVAMRYRLAGFLYLLLTFFAIPFLLIYFSEK